MKHLSCCIRSITDCETQGCEAICFEDVHVHVRQHCDFTCEGTGTSLTNNWGSWWCTSSLVQSLQIGLNDSSGVHSKLHRHGILHEGWQPYCWLWADWVILHRWLRNKLFNTSKCLHGKQIVKTLLYSKALLVMSLPVHALNFKLVPLYSIHTPVIHCKLQQLLDPAMESSYELIIWTCLQQIQWQWQAWL